MVTCEYPARVGDMTPEMYSSSLVAMSVMAAIGRPQLAICLVRIRTHTLVADLQDPRNVYLALVSRV